MQRKLIYMDAKSSKFWNIDLKDASHTVTYGRIGSTGQSATKEFASADLARKDAEKLVPRSWRHRRRKRLSHPGRGRRADPAGGLLVHQPPRRNRQERRNVHRQTRAGLPSGKAGPNRYRLPVPLGLRGANLIPNLDLLDTPAAAETTTLIIGA